MSKIERCPEDVGCVDQWIGSVEQWMDDEQKRGKLTEQRKREVLALNDTWLANRYPVSNSTVKRELTARLRAVVAK